jgi:hypothetical protein
VRAIRHTRAAQNGAATLRYRMFVDNRRHLARNGHAMRLGNRTLHDRVTLLFL